MKRPAGESISAKPAASEARPTGRAGVCIERRWPVLVLSAATVGLLSLVFEPIALWPVAYVALVPWLVAVLAARRTGWVYLVSYLTGAAFFGINLHWLVPITGLGYVALLPYLAAYFLLAAWGVRLMHRRGWLPVSLATAIFWVGCEYLRGWVITGFPWFLLAHSQYRVLPAIQVCDLVGAYGLSFLLAMVNGWLAAALTMPLSKWSAATTGQRVRFFVGTVVTAVAVAGTFVYGGWRLSQQSAYDGPAVTVVQRNYPQLVEWSPERELPAEKLAHYRRMVDQAIQGGADPDLIVLPESALPTYLNRQYREVLARVVELEDADEIRLHQEVIEWVRGLGRPVVLGGGSCEWRLLGEEVRRETFNSAFVYYPTEPEPQRYDKMHRVLFGEYVPFRYTRLHWLYKRLNSITPWGKHVEYSIEAGRWPTVFELTTRESDRRRFRFAVPICYEDVMPQATQTLVRGGGRRKQADFLLNISNDGWFDCGSELPQHLAICVFRAVEHRVGVARAVNTGISALIGPEGRIDAELAPGEIGTASGVVRLDQRTTLYTRWGDWLACGCQGLAIILLLAAKAVGLAEWIRRRSTAREKR